MKTVANTFKMSTLFVRIRFIEHINDISERSLALDNDMWLLFVAVSTISSAASRTIDAINFIGNSPTITAKINNNGDKIAHPNHHPNDVSIRKIKSI